jgi:ATP-binding cassette subfamily F protein uup
MEGEGRVTAYPGGWSDYVAQRPEAAPLPETRSVPETSAPKLPKDPRKDRQGLSFAQKKRLDDLPALIDRLTAEIARLSDLLSTPGFYEREPVKFRKATEMLADRQAALTAAEDEWLELAEKA